MIITKKEDIQIKSLSNLKGFANHHTAMTSKVQFKTVDKVHKEKFNFKSAMGFWVGYNFIIEKDGTILQARKLGEVLAAHRGWNKTYGAICLAGDFTKEKPTQAQKDSLFNLYSWITEIKAVPLYYRHGDLMGAKTLCPALPKSFYQDIYNSVPKTVIQSINVTLNRKVL